jgi:hypothetical protein
MPLPDGPSYEHRPAATLATVGEHLLAPHRDAWAATGADFESWAGVPAGGMPRGDRGAGGSAVRLRLYVSIVAYPPDRRARDVDNLLKAVLDGMQAAGVYLNDTQICTLSITKSRTIHPGGLLFVGVQPAEAANWRDALKEDAA